jgi:hypothetical protein
MTSTIEIESVFDSFPWPQTATVKHINAVAAAARELRRVRAEALPKMKLRAFYRTLELPGGNPLKDAHPALDTAVLTAYGFGAKKDLLAQLLALNQQVAAKIEKGEPVTAPGMSKNYPDAKKLVTEDCIKPPTAKSSAIRVLTRDGRRCVKNPKHRMPLEVHHRSYGEGREPHASTRRWTKPSNSAKKSAPIWSSDRRWRAAGE